MFENDKLIIEVDGKRVELKKGDKIMLIMRDGKLSRLTFRDHLNLFIADILNTVADYLEPFAETLERWAGK